MNIPKRLGAIVAIAATAATTDVGAAAGQRGIEASSLPICVSVVLAPPVQGVDPFTANAGATTAVISRMTILRQREGIEPYGPDGEPLVTPTFGSSGINPRCISRHGYQVNIRYKKRQSNDSVVSTLEIIRNRQRIFERRSDVDLQKSSWVAEKNNFYRYILIDAIGHSDLVLRNIK